MQTIKKLKQGIAKLPREELFLFREWFYDFDAKVWDKQMEQDVKSGKLDRWANQAINDFRAGKYKEL